MRRILVYQDEDGVWVVEVPSLPGCNTQGDTYEEALANAKDAIALHIESMVAHGEEVPEDLPSLQLVEV
jgi:predicted RNase H-like HicB family nuclease